MPSCSGGEEAGSFRCGACRAARRRMVGTRPGVVPMIATPATGRLVAMDSPAGAFTDGIARLIRLRDRVGRTPRCDARCGTSTSSRPIRTAASPARPTGKADRVLQPRQTRSRQHSRIRPGTRHAMETTTPTGHTYRSRAPARAETRPPAAPPRPQSEREARLCRSVLVAQSLLRPVGLLELELTSSLGEAEGRSPALSMLTHRKKVAGRQTRPPGRCAQLL